MIDAPFLTNHDKIRLATQLAGDRAWLRSAAAILLTLPGAPFLYYGEEVGLENGPGSKDESKRTPMPWNAAAGGGFTTGTPWFDFAPGQETANVEAESADPGSLLSWYRRLILVRHGSAALRKGSLTMLDPMSSPESSQVLAFVRTAGKERVLVVHNLGSSEVEAGPYGLAAKSVEPLLVTAGRAGAPTRTPQGWTMRLPAGGSGVWRLR